jgi:HEAT repeat protein
MDRERPSLPLVLAALLSISAIGAARPGLLFAEGDPPASADALLRQLSSPDYGTRREAVLAVEGRTEETLLARVLELAGHDPHPNIRAAAVLARLAGTDEWPGPRQSAYVSLGRLRDARAYDLLLAGLSDDNVAAYAARGLGLLGDARALPGIQELIETKPSAPCVAQMGPEAVLLLSPTDGETWLLAHLDSAPGVLRQGIAWALEAHPSEDARRAMIALLARPDADLRAVCLQVLAKVGKADCIPALLDLFAREPGDRARVVPVLESVRAVDSTPLLVKTLALAEDPQLRRAIAHALGAFRRPETLRPLVQALAAEKDGLTQVQLLVALGDLGDAHALSVVMEHADDPLITSQPPEISSIRPFPWNARVGDVAVWAAATLVDGRAPFDVQALSAFPAPRPTQQMQAQRERLGRFWATHAADPRYSIDR